MEESSSLGINDLTELQKDLLSVSSGKGLADSAGDHNSATGAQGAFADSKNSGVSAIVIDGKTYNIDDVMEMKKKIDDLMLVNESRDKKIAEVGMKKERRLKEYIRAFSHSITFQNIKC